VLRVQSPSQASGAGPYWKEKRRRHVGKKEKRILIPERFVFQSPIQMPREVWVQGSSTMLRIHFQEEEPGPSGLTVKEIEEGAKQVTHAPGLAIMEKDQTEDWLRDEIWCW